MEKWFRNSLMALGILFMLLIEMSILGISRDKSFENLCLFIYLAALSLSGITLISGLGLLIQSIGKGLGRVFGKKEFKAKRGLSYEESRLNHILRRLNDEERGYLEAYLNGQVYQPSEDFSNYSDNHMRRKKQNSW